VGHKFSLVCAVVCQEGVKLKVGGEGKRGRLLVQDPSSSANMNVLQLLANLEDADPE